MRSLRTRISATILAAVPTACTVGPDFTAPEPPSAARYSAPGEASVREADAGTQAPKQTVTIGERVTAEWWTLFRSPDLDVLVKQAIAGNRTLESAKSKLKEAREAVTAATGALYPQVDFSASATRQKVTATSFGLPPGSFPLPPNFNLYQFGPSVSYALDLFGGTRREIEQQSALADVHRHQLDAAYLMLTGNTVAQAVQLAAARAQSSAIEDILAIDHQNADLVGKKREAGTAPDSDVVTAESQIAADETLRPGPEQQLSVAKHALAVLLGRAPGDWTPPDLELSSLVLPGRLPVSLPSELIHQRPDILAAEAQLHAASARIGVATAALYPNITLSASIGTAALAPKHLFDPSSLMWSIAAGLTEPIFDGGMREADRRAALAAFKAAAADYQETVLQAFGQVADILQALAHDAQLLGAQQHALDMASQSVRLQGISYSGGGTGILDLLDAQRQYQQARLGYVRAEAQRYQNTVQLLVAMGGGWWDVKLDSDLDGKRSVEPVQSTHRDAF